MIRAAGKTEGMEPPKPEPDNVSNSASHDADEPTHANEPSGGDDRWLRWVVHNSSGVVTIVDLDGTLRYASPAFERVLGYDPEQAVGTMNVLDHVHLDDLPHVLEETEKAVSAGGIVTNKAEYRFRHRDGSWRWMESIGTYLLDDPQIRGVVVASRDITERKETEEALRRSEAEIFEVLESITDAFFAVDREWRFTYVNSHAQVLFSRAREDLIGERIWEDPTFYPEYRKAVAEGITARFEAYYPPLGAWYSVRAYPSESGLSVYLQDISERKWAEERIRFQSELLDTVGQAVIATDLEGKVLYWNRAAEELYGWSAEEVMGRSVAEFGVTEDLQGRLAEIMEELRAGRTWSGEFTVLRKDGSSVPVLATNTPVYDERGNLSGIIGVSADITERVRAEEALRDAEERYRTLVEQIPAVIYIDRATDGPDEPLYTSPQIEEMLGYTPEEWMGGRLWPKRLHPDDKARVLAADERFETGADERFSEEYRLIAKDDRVVWVHEDAVTIGDEAGEPLYWQGVIFDVTERKEAEERLAESEQRFRSAFEDAGIGMAISNPDGRYLQVNRAFCGIVGYAEDELLGMTFREITHPDDLEEDLRLERGILEGEGRSFSMEKRYVRKDGLVVWVHLTVSILRAASGDPLYSIAQAQDITGRKRMEDQLKHRALHDALTGLPNRNLFVDRLGHALERTRRRRGRKVAVLFMDLDGFKVVNDSLGHEVGDLLLTVVAQRLQCCLRKEDTLARFGGDEFVVLLEEVERPEDAVLAAERITEELGRPFVLGGRNLFASASIGISLGDARSKTPDDLLRDADTAMYRAKDEHLPYMVFDPAMYKRALKRLEIENDLRRAVEAKGFVVHYQPIVDLASGEARGVEALLRWEHPERGLLDPSEFLGVAEESGLVIALGERVLEDACRQARRWQEDPSIPSLVLSVNLSAAHLRRTDLVETVEQTLRKTGLDARRLSLEVTETAYISVLDDKSAALERLKALGVKLSIDDFGAGYSSLSYLKRLPVDILKIDRAFLGGLGEDARDTAIVRLVIDLAHTLGMRVVAEGVENWAQAALLKEMGCDMAQGFYFARPLPPEEVSELLTR